MELKLGSVFRANHFMYDANILPSGFGPHLHGPCRWYIWASRSSMDSTPTLRVANGNKKRNHPRRVHVEMGIESRLPWCYALVCRSKKPAKFPLNPFFSANLKYLIIDLYRNMRILNQLQTFFNESLWWPSDDYHWIYYCPLDDSFLAQWISSNALLPIWTPNWLFLARHHFDTRTSRHVQVAEYLLAV
jgi:hypothetical protein